MLPKLVMLVQYYNNDALASLPRNIKLHVSVWKCERLISGVSGPVPSFVCPSEC